MEHPEAGEEDTSAAVQTGRRGPTPSPAFQQVPLA